MAPEWKAAAHHRPRPPLTRCQPQPSPSTEPGSPQPQILSTFGVSGKVAPPSAYGHWQGWESYPPASLGSTVFTGGPAISEKHASYYPEPRAASASSARAGGGAQKTKLGAANGAPRQPAQPRHSHFPPLLVASGSIEANTRFLFLPPLGLATAPWAGELCWEVDANGGPPEPAKQQDPNSK